MKYVLEPSLEHITNIKIAVAICFEDDVKNLLRKFYFPSRRGIKTKLIEIENILVQKVEKLPLPKNLKEKLLCLTRPVGFQISKWKQFHNNCNIRVNLPKEFFWTPQGTIDRKKTAEGIIKAKSITITERYKLACIYCFEDDIKKLWEKMSEDCRRYFYDQDEPLYVNENELVVFWTYHLMGEVDKLDDLFFKRMNRQCSLYQYLFEIAATDGNRAATEFFLEKLTPVEREFLLETVISLSVIRSSVRVGFLKESISDIFCFLLSELNEEQQIEVFKRCGYQVLICFLDWPLQIFFMEMANCMWNYLDESIYGELLLQITDKIKHGYKDYDYRKLFGEFWKKTSNDYKKNVFWKNFDVRIVSDLFEIRDKDNINLIFQDATPKDKKYLIYSNDAKYICKELTNSDQLDLLKYFIKECLPSENEVIEFKDNLQNGNVWFETVTKTPINNTNTFLCVLDDISSEFKKRKCEEGDS